MSAISVLGKKVFIGGYFTKAQTITRNYLAAYDTGTFTLQSWNPNANNYVYSIVSKGSSVYVAGDFTSIDTTTRSYVASVDTITGTPKNWTPSINGTVRQMYLQSNNLIYLCGSFSVVNNSARQNICAVDTGNNYLTPFSATFDETNISNHYVGALGFLPSKLIAGGGFATTMSVPKNYLALYNYNTTSLPVKFLNLNAQQFDQNIQLNWSTASEINNSHFDIIRSIDNLNWKTIGTVKGNGNRISESNYIFNDEISTMPSNEVLYYRVKQADFNNTFEYSNIVSVCLNNQIAMYNPILYPNPFSDKIVLRFDTAPSKETSIEIYDLYGTLLFTHKVEASFTTGEYVIEPNCLLKNAFYFLKVNNKVFKLLKN